MTPDEARAFLREHHYAVLSTIRSDGRPQLSPVTVGIDGEGRVIMSTMEATAKYRNLRRDPRVSACVFLAAVLRAMGLGGGHGADRRAAGGGRAAC